MQPLLPTLAGRMKRLRRPLMHLTTWLLTALDMVMQLNTVKRYMVLYRFMLLVRG